MFHFNLNGAPGRKLGTIRYILAGNVSDVNLEIVVMNMFRPSPFDFRYCYAVLTAAVCLGLAGLLLFFLFPRPVVIAAPKGRLYPYYRHVTYDNATDPKSHQVSVKYYVSTFFIVPRGN